MWEQRWIWPGKPAWWEGAWRRGLAVLSAQGREVEKRPDSYLVLLDRPEAGLKLRGGAEDDFDLKVLHSRAGGWELWEKVAYFKWNALEAIRLATMLQIPLPDLGSPQGMTPGNGVDAFLAAARLTRREVLVDKVRLQCRAADLLPALPGMAFDDGSLAELVELTIPRRPPMYSFCAESMSPREGAIDAQQAGPALRCGYPELLIRHLQGVL